MCSVQFDPGLVHRIARMQAFDVVHSQNERGSLLLAAGVARVLGVPHVHTFHSNYAGIHESSPVAGALCSTVFLPGIHRALRVAARGASPSLPDQRQTDVAAPRFAADDWRNIARIAGLTDAFTAPAPFVISAIEDAAGGGLAGRGFVVPSGVSERFLAVQRSRPRGPVTRFLSCGRLGAEKRVDAIIQAFGLLGRDDAELIVIGDGDERDRLRRLAERVEHGTIQFAGHIGDVSRLASEFADADVFVLASHGFDTQAMVLAEAAAAGTPILYCDGRLSVGVTPDNSLLVGPSPAELAAGMRRLMDAPARLDAMARASKELGPALSAARTAADYRRIYDAAGERRAARRGASAGDRKRGDLAS